MCFLSYKINSTTEIQNFNYKCWNLNMEKVFTQLTFLNENILLKDLCTTDTIHVF